MSAASRFVESKIRQRKVMMFAKRRDPSCQLAMRTLERYAMTRDVFEVCEIDRRHDCSLIENHFLVICLVSQRRVPRLFVDGRYIGSESEIQRLHESGELANILQAAGAVATSAAELQHQSSSSASFCDPSLSNVPSGSTDNPAQYDAHVAPDDGV